MLVRCFIDTMFHYSKLNIIKKDIINWLKLTTKQVQVQVMKDLR